MSIIQAIRIIRSMRLRAVYSVTAGEFRIAYPGSKRFEVAETPEEALSVARLMAFRIN